MSLAFADRPPTKEEIERIRLILSAYQDGSGMLPNGDATLPGWRDFERSIALALNGRASENKDIFDVVLTDPRDPKIKYGISCKMRRELDRIKRDGRVTIEVSNSYQKFWEHLSSKGINHENCQSKPNKVGASLLELVKSWHEAVGLKSGGEIDLMKSCYLSLQWNRSGFYQLFQFPLTFHDFKALVWSFPPRRLKGREVPGKHLIGAEKTGTLFEWYGESGGQLKYYPLATKAIWKSSLLTLEPLPGNTEYGVKLRAAAYFPKLWAACQNS